MTLALLVLACIPGQDRVPATEADLDAAIRRIPSYKTATYDLDLADHVNSKGELVQNPEEKTKDQLNCTTFASPTLHLLVRGSFEGFNQSVVNGYGDAVAAYYGLVRTMQWTSESIGTDIDDKDWRKAHAGVYYFDIRKDKDGHVGFLVIKPAGVRQVHFSGLKDFNGLADNEAFLETFLRVSKYKEKAAITLYLVTRPEKKDDKQ